jgi:hypothetical protein
MRLIPSGSAGCAVWAPSGGSPAGGSLRWAGPKGGLGEQTSKLLLYVWIRMQSV